jgi:lysophospholipase L1-like esterase
MKCLLTLFLALGLFPVKSFGAGFAIRDGDTVVFLGDSITAARQYGKVIENYTLLRFPERKVKFVNAGKGGETAKGSLDRLEQAVFAEGATLVTVAYGVNDIGWGMKADAAHKAEYLEGIGKLVERCQQRGVRVFICSAAITAEEPARAEIGFLQKMCDEGLTLAKTKGAGVIDVQRTMREVQRRVLAANAKQPDKSKHTKLHADDGVHLNELGQMAMAFAILKGLGAPAEVSSATLHAGKGTVLASEGCQVNDLKWSGDELSFNRQDERLPLNLQPLWTLHGMFIPFSGELNRYLLTVKNLSTNRYEVFANERLLGTWTAEALSHGINIASATADPWQPGGPWDAQGHAVKVFTDMRDELVFARRGLAAHLATHPGIESLRAKTGTLEQSLLELQREIARPIPIHFAIRKAAKPSASPASNPSSQK